MFPEIRAWLQPWYNKWAVMVLSAAIGLGGYEWICWSKLSASDWGTWAGAIGTVLTLIWTIRLATAETRQRERAEHDLALITAANFSIRIPEVGFSLGVLRSQLESDNTKRYPTDYRECLGIVRIAAMWTPSELTPLLSIGQGLAVRLGFAAAEISTIVELLQNAKQNPGLTQSDSELILNRKIIERINYAHKHLASTRQDCEKFLWHAGITEQFGIHRPPPSDP